MIGLSLNVPASLLALALFTASPVAAQSGVILGTDEELLHILNDNGNIAVDFNVDGLDTPQDVRFGLADLAGTNEADTDLDESLRRDSPFTIIVF